jgi:very-short-patch-repair endonuclease
MLPRNKNLKQPARVLRGNMTEAERKLWSRIRGKQMHGLQFYRQKVIGNYIVDFFCHKAKIVIEVDGGQHFENPGLENDSKRDAYLQSLGLTVIRINNLDVLTNMDGVIQMIWEELKGVS